MKIEQLKIKNFKVFQNIDIRNLPSMCVFLGANGSGKSTLFDVFGFLSDALKYNVKVAIDRRGGFKEVISREQTGEIEFEIKFRNDKNNKNEKTPLITYSLKVGLEGGFPIVTEEVLQYRRGKTGTPWKFLNFRKGQGEAILNEEKYGEEGANPEREKQSLDSPDILAIKGLGQFQKFKAISDFRRLLENWYISNFSIQNSRQPQDVGLSEHLSEYGENLSLVTQYMFQNYPEKFELVLKKMRERVPGIGEVSAKTTEDGRVVLKFKDSFFKDPFIARYVSDGTLKMFAYLVLLHDPKPHPLLCIEEPENYLHPELLSELAEEFREYASEGQVFISTHSPDLVNEIELEELFWIQKQNGFSTIQRAKDDKTVRNLVEAGDKLGYLWMQKYLKGSGPKE